MLRGGCSIWCGPDLLEVLAAYTCLPLLECLFAGMRGIPGSMEMRDLMRLGNLEPNLFESPSCRAWVT